MAAAAAATTPRTADFAAACARAVPDTLRKDRGLFATLLVVWMLGGYFLFIYTSARHGAFEPPRAADPPDPGARAGEPAEEARLRRRVAQLARGGLSQARLRAEEDAVRRRLPPLCRLWSPAACEAWVRETLALRARERRRNATRGHGAGRESPRAVQLVLRGPHFQRWWPHVVPQVAASAAAECPAPCDVRLPKDAPARPLRAPDGETAVVVVDTLEPGPRPPLATPRAANASVAVVALETGRRAATHGRRALGATDWLVSWSRQSEVPVNYMYAWQGPCGVPQGAGRAPNSTAGWDRALERCMAPAPRTARDMARRTRLAAAFISNCAATERLAFYRELLAHLPEGSVDSWGRCARTPGLPPEAVAAQHLPAGAYRLPVAPRGRGRHAQQGPARSANKVALLAGRGYKFALALENGIHRDYVTEKALHAVLAGVVPVVWGAPEAADFLPGGRGSFIDALDYESPRALAEHLMALDLDDGAYLRYFAWRSARRGPGVTPQFAALQRQSFTALGADSWPCRLCRAVAAGGDAAAAG